jgi:hypothetical protein
MKHCGIKDDRSSIAMVKLVRGCAVELRGHLPTPRIPLCSLADDPQSAQLIVHRRMQGTMHESVFVSLQVAEALRVPSYSQVRRFYTKGPKYSKSTGLSGHGNPDIAKDTDLHSQKTGRKSAHGKPRGMDRCSPEGPNVVRCITLSSPDAKRVVGM